MQQEKLQRESAKNEKKGKVFHYADIEKVHTETPIETRDDNSPKAGTVIQAAVRVECPNECLNE